MLYALAKEEPYFESRLFKVVLLAPCTIYANPPPGILEIYTAGLDVFNISGDTWEADKEKACSVMNPIFCSDMDVFDDKQMTSFKSNFHMAQTWKAQQFQEFVLGYPEITKGRQIDLT